MTDHPPLPFVHQNLVVSDCPTQETVTVFIPIVSATPENLNRGALNLLAEMNPESPKLARIHEPFGSELAKSFAALILLRLTKIAMSFQCLYKLNSF